MTLSALHPVKDAIKPLENVRHASLVDGGHSVTSTAKVPAHIVKERLELVHHVDHSAVHAVTWLTIVLHVIVGDGVCHCVKMNVVPIA